MLTMASGVPTVLAIPLPSIQRSQLIALKMGDDTMHIRMDLTGNYHLYSHVSGLLTKNPMLIFFRGPNDQKQNEQLDLAYDLPQ